MQETEEQLRIHTKTALEFYRAFDFDRIVWNQNRGASAPHMGRERASALQLLGEGAASCQGCALCGGRKNIVFGEGNPEARIMFIGEAPGREEDLQGKPFVGDAGQLLTRLIEKLGLSRQEVYIANIVKCRPPANRDPQQDEIAACLPHLKRQIGIIAPEVIVSLGKIAAHTLAGINEPLDKFSITRFRGKFFDYTGAGSPIPVMPTFHPAYLLRTPKDKWLTWEDMQAVLRKIQ